MILTIAMINQERCVNKKSLLITVITFWSLLSWESYPLWPSIRPRPGDYIIIILIIIIVFWSLPSWEGGLQYVPDQTCFFKVQLGQSAPGGRTRAIGFSKKISLPFVKILFSFIFFIFSNTLSGGRKAEICRRKTLGGRQPIRGRIFPRNKKKHFFLLHSFSYTFCICSEFWCGCSTSMFLATCLCFRCRFSQFCSILLR